MLSNSEVVIAVDAGSEPRWVSYRDERGRNQLSVKVPKFQLSVNMKRSPWSKTTRRWA